ncbi:MAG: VCBS repeat-containing protein, partial [Candidatus Doudnabacteria bacterium]|nr:VCBS repeat-containing protein [Candidatus Doudnabacteria bacterium]
RPSDNEAINPLESLEYGTRFSEPVAAPRYKTEVLPYGQVASGANIALGDIDGDLEQELITGAGPGGGPHIRTFELDGTPITSFFAYDEGFRGGVDVAAGDTNGDGIDEIIVGAGPGGGPHIRVLTADGAEISNFFAYAQTFRGGIRVDAGDLDGDGIDEIVSGAGPGGGPHVQAFTQDGTPQANFMAFDPNFRNGIDVAVIDADETREARIAAAAGPGGGPHVRVFDTAGNPTAGFFAFGESFRGGTRINHMTVGSSNRLLVAPASGGGAHVRQFYMDSVPSDDNQSTFETWWRGGYDIAGGTDIARISSAQGNRRTTVRRINF